MNIIPAKVLRFAYSNKLICSLQRTNTTLSRFSFEEIKYAMIVNKIEANNANLEFVVDRPESYGVNRLWINYGLFANRTDTDISKVLGNPEGHGYENRLAFSDLYDY